MAIKIFRGLQLLLLTIVLMHLYLPFAADITVFKSKSLHDPKFWLLALFLSELGVFSIQIDKKTYFDKISAILTNKKIILSISLLVLLHFFINKALSLSSLSLSGADFSHYDYALWNTSQGRPFNISIIEQDSYYTNLLGNHFSFGLALLAPFMWLFESHYFLPFIQALVLGTSFFIIYRLTKKYIDHSLSLLIPLAAIFNPFMIETFKYEFHIEIFYIPILILLCDAIYDMLIKQKKVYFKFLVLTLLLFSIKEDSFLIFGGLWLPYLFYKGRLKKKLLISLVGVLSILLFIAVYKFAMPLFQLPRSTENSGSFIGFWGHYGQTLGEILATMAKSPHLIFKDIFGRFTLYKLLLPFCFVPLLTPAALAIAPALLINLTSAISPMNGLALYYGAPIIAIVIFSFLLGLQKIKSMKMRTTIILLAFTFNMALGIGKYRLPKPNIHFAPIQSELGQITHLLNAQQAGYTYLSGNLLVLLPYSQRFKRIWNDDFFINYADNVNLIIIAKLISSFPYTPEKSKRLTEKLRSTPSYEILYDGQELIVFKRRT